MNPNRLLPLSDTWVLPRPLAAGLLAANERKSAVPRRIPKTATTGAEPSLWRRSLAEMEASRLPLWLTFVGFILFGALVVGALAVTGSEIARLADPAGLDFAVKALLK